MTKSPDRLLEGAGPGRASEVRCRHCQDRVLVITANRRDAFVYLVAHLENDHNVSNVLLDGQDFTIGPAPHRCDLCFGIAEPPWWTYTTTPGVAEDPDWLVCDVCHDLIRTSLWPLPALVKRSLAIQQETLVLDGVPVDDLREHISGMLASMLANLVGEPVRSTE